MKIYMCKDEMYPVYYTATENLYYERVVEIPDELYENIAETWQQFREMQKNLKEFYEKGTLTSPL